MNKKKNFFSLIEDSNLTKTENFSLELSKSENLVIDWDSIKAQAVHVVIGENVCIEMLETGRLRNQEMSFELLPYAALKLSSASLEKIGKSKKTFILHHDASAEVAQADFSSGKNETELVFILQGSNSSAHYHLAALATKDDKKKFSVSFFHDAINTASKMDNYGVAEENSDLQFIGKSYIRHGAVKSRTRQNGKIMVFDEACSAKVQPILEIAENDVEASHAAAVGKVNDEHLFYLCSRGLSENEAKRIITLGYLKPILQYFTEESMKKIIQESIERRI